MRMIATALIAVAALVGTPAGDVEAALSHAQTLPAEVRAVTRYLSLTHVPLVDRGRAVIAARMAVNSVSRNRLPVAVESIDHLHSMLVLRLDLLADPRQPQTLSELHAAWERLAAADPWYHIRAQVLAGGKAKVITVPGGWTGLGQATALRLATGSEGAVLRLEWWLSRVCSPPGYYEWAGVPGTQAELFASLGIDQKTVNGLAADHAANMLRSGVTGRTRRIIRTPGPLGDYWRTKDPDQQQRPDADPFASPVDVILHGLKQQYRFAAGEDIWSRPNGMLGYALFDSQGKRQDSASPIGVHDTTAPAGHTDLVPMISCVRCHDAGDSGFRDFTDQQSKLRLNPKTDPLVAQRIAELYADQERLQQYLTRAREDYARACQRCTGTTPKEAATALTATYAAYVYDLVSPTVVARELVIPADLLGDILAGCESPAVQLVRQGESITRRDWENAYHEAALAAEAWRAQH